MDKQRLIQIGQDFMGDLTQDTHGVWEIFEFTRQHCLEYSDEDIFETGMYLLEQFAQLGWVEVSQKPLQISTVTCVDDLLQDLRKRGSKALTDHDNLPSVDITEKGEKEYGAFSL